MIVLVILLIAQENAEERKCMMNVTFVVDQESQQDIVIVSNISTIVEMFVVELPNSMSVMSVEEVVSLMVIVIVMVILLTVMVNAVELI